MKRVISEREVYYDLDNEEVVALAIKIATENILLENFSGFRVEVEDFPYVEPAGSNVGRLPESYYTLNLYCESKIKPFLLGVPHTGDMISVDKAVYSETGAQALIERGERLADMLRVAMPEAVVTVTSPSLL